MHDHHNIPAVVKYNVRVGVSDPLVPPYVGDFSESLLTITTPFSFYPPLY